VWTAGCEPFLRAAAWAFHLHAILPPLPKGSPLERAEALRMRNCRSHILVVQVRHDCSPLELRRALLSIHRRILREAAQGSGLSFGDEDEEAAQAAAEPVAQQEQRQEQKQKKQTQTAAREDVDDAAMPAAAVRQVFRFCRSQVSKPYSVPAASLSWQRYQPL